MMDPRHYISGGNPRKLIGIVVLTSVVLLLLWLFMVSRMDYTRPDQTAPATSERQEQMRELTGRTAETAPADLRSGRFFMNALSTFVVMVVLLGGVWFWTRTRSASKGQSGLFREMGHHVIGPGQHIRIMEVNNEVWVLGVGSGGITLLHRCPVDEWKPVAGGDKTANRRFYDFFSQSS